MIECERHEDDRCSAVSGCAYRGTRLSRYPGHVPTQLQRKASHRQRDEAGSQDPVLRPLIAREAYVRLMARRSNDGGAFRCCGPVLPSSDEIGAVVQQHQANDPNDHRLVHRTGEID